MFKRITRRFGKKKSAKRMNGLSKGLTVVDNLMIPGLKVCALDRNYGKAEVTLKLMKENGEITANELGASMITLNNQYDKLRKEAEYAEMYT